VIAGLGQKKHQVVFISISEKNVLNGRTPRLVRLQEDNAVDGFLLICICSSHVKLFHQRQLLQASLCPSWSSIIK
jgi:hypothetical protein